MHPRPIAAARRKTSHPLAAGALFAAVLALGGCVETAVGVGAGAAVGAVQERGLEQAAIDTRISAQINYKWLESDKELFLPLATEVYEGRVLLTGVVKTEAARDLAVKLTWQVDGVKEVINEIIVDPSGKTGTFARDTWISTQLKSKILVDKDIMGINYAIETVRHVVYLFGVAQNRAELDRVINYARNIEYVERVVNHVLLKDDPRRQQPAGAAPPPSAGMTTPSGTSSGGAETAAPSGDTVRTAPSGGAVTTVPLDGTETR